MTVRCDSISSEPSPETTSKLWQAMTPCRPPLELRSGFTARLMDSILAARSRPRERTFEQIKGGSTFKGPIERGATVAVGRRSDLKDSMALHLGRRDKIARRFFAVFGIILASQGAYAMWRGLPAYPNYWGGVVFPGLAIALGLCVTIACIFFPRWFSRK